MKNNYKILVDNASNIIGQLEDNNSDYYFFWKYANRVTFKELKNTNLLEDSVIRVFSITSAGCNIQFRNHCSITENGKEKDMIATAFLSKEDLVFLLNKMKEREL